MATFPELASRVVAITGAAQGIGAETARHFAAQGTAVALLDIDAKGAQTVADAIVAAGGRAKPITVDVTDEQSVNAAVAATVEAFGGLDILITCAGGYTRLAQVEDMPLDEWERTIALNLRSAFLCSKAVIPHLKKSKAGRIIHVASISGRTVHASSSPAYGSAKAAVIQLTRFLAWELGPSNITANAVAPITTLTPRVAALRSEADVARIAAQVPLRRLATPADHAQVMLFLASDGAAFLNGTVQDVNGGRVMM
jgi:3-oxoacyl-[acyl-carrier protein] reductase